jgi:serine/threonine protein kinase
LEFDPSKRITVEEALAHPYLSAYHDEDDEVGSDEEEHTKAHFFCLYSQHIIRLLISHLK